MADLQPWVESANAYRDQADSNRSTSGTWRDDLPSPLSSVLVRRRAPNPDELSLSPHIVESHLRHAFHKLDVRSRVDLTRVVLTHEPTVVE